MIAGTPRNRHHIELTPEEQEIVARIDLRYPLPWGVDGHAIYLANQQPILDLLRSLSTRDAIPKQRIAYFKDPAYKSGRTKGSRKEGFERNGTTGAEIYTHPNFLPYLKYFLFGADLPQGAIDEFEAQIGDPRWFSGSDILALTKKTREIVRKYRLQNHDDEFFRLAIDNGLSTYNAESVRKHAREAARR